MNRRELQRVVAELPEAELELLAALWNHGPQTAASLRELIKPFRPMTHSAVLTLMKRLQDRGVVVREKSGQGKAYRFSPVVPKQSGQHHLLRRVTNRLFEGSRAAVVSALLADRTPTADEITEIRQILDRMEAEQKQRGK